MTRWMLDDGPFGILARCADASWSWRPSSFYVADTVAKGASKDKSGRRQDLLSLEMEGESVVIARAVEVGSDADTTLWGHLRKQQALASRDLGENESIALLIHEMADAVFVVLDRKAAMVAWAELGHGRVASPFDYWDWLRAEGVIDQAAFDLLCERVTREDTGLPGIPVRFR